MITPNEFLPPPWYFKLWIRCMIYFGHLTGKGYWFWNMKEDILYWNAQQNEVFGINQPFSVGSYHSVFSRNLWDDDDREHVKKTVELARHHKSIFRHQFCIKDATTGEKVIVDAKGRWIFDEHTGEPWAMWGWNKRLPLDEEDFKTKEAAIKLRQRLNKWREEGLPEDVSECVAACYQKYAGTR